MNMNSTVGDLITTLIDYRGKTPPKASSGVPLITAKVIKGGVIRAEPREYIAEESYDAWMRRGLPSSGDILITTEAPLGEVARVGRDARIALAQRVILLQPDESKVDPSFMFHYLRSPQAQAALGRRSSGTTVTGIRQPELRGLEIPLIGRTAQEVVGAVLDGIDDLIENNRRRVEVLEEMARAMYREWFVKFRFPGHEDVPMVDSARGPIPEGWRVATLESIAQVNQSSRKPDVDETFRYLDIGALSECHIGEMDFIQGSAAPGRARRIVGPGDTVWSTVRPNRRAHALVVAPGDDWIASTGLAILTPSAVSSAFLFETTSTLAFSDWLVGRATGSAYPAVRAKDFEAAPVVVPPPEVDAEFMAKVGPMHDLIWRLSGESTTLAGLRDLLLPKLVTGQIDVSKLDLDAIVSEGSVEEEEVA